MKLVKVILSAAFLLPGVASAQDAPTPIFPTNFVFAPIVTAFVALPIIFGDNDNNPAAPVSTR